MAFHPPHEQHHRHAPGHRRGADDDGVWVTTKGDANDAADPWGRIRVSGSQVWVVRDVIPKVGSFDTFVKEPAIRLVLLDGVVLFGIAVALDAIWRS